ncbi:MAG: MoaD/ThiS family protein [Sphingopyxis sp.]|uniref:MoaD/ThiS family protein n=1 Tax=Sphingopyxis sp. TaxID=1908224 RepID=UPI002ABB090D|nr:MoaD/ThiS family protein [Sphingopyxis sp.]MDZ3831264.1 MoaD/ThiS family protein [Sphingopyxis sp.]
MALHLSYFAWVRDRMGMAEETVEPPAGIENIAALIAWLAARDGRGARAFADEGRIRVAIDGRMAGPESVIAGARDVALFPPVTGG